MKSKSQIHQKCIGTTTVKVQFLKKLKKKNSFEVKQLFLSIYIVKDMITR